MKAQTYTILLTLEDSFIPSAKDVQDVISDVFNQKSTLATVSVVFGNVSLMNPALVRKHTDISSEYSNR